MGAVTLLTVLLPIDVLAASPRSDAGFQGTSSQRSGSLALPVGLRVSKSARQVTRFDIQWTSECSSPTGRGSLDGLSVTLKRPIGRYGSFSDRTTLTRDLGDNQKGVLTVVLKGRFTKKTTARGTFKVTILIRNAAKQQVDTCDSATARWTVRD
ncbi:MAG: hypothetical protein WKF42_09295 [Solirubrobacteraceae bacterium]